MRDYLSLFVRSKNLQISQDGELTKPTKAPSVSIVSNLLGHFKKIAPSVVACTQYNFEFNERAAILEFEAGLSRSAAEFQTKEEMRNWYELHCCACASEIDNGQCGINCKETHQ